jgi:hypothetical protein
MTNFEKFINIIDGYNYEIFTTGDHIINLYIKNKNERSDELWLREIDNIKNISPINAVKKEINEMTPEHFERFIKHIEPDITNQILL